ncbi:MAG: 8-amino-7-oxononanoate synthase [Planctomycetota bacterium]|nr:8-amino-7-oxononanoate synthase [Planctomycetota bacterium]
MRPVRKNACGTTVPMPETGDFMSNDYLGLRSHERVCEAAAKAARHAVGAGGSRLMSGDHPVHGQLEDALCELKGSPAALVVPSGYHANVSVLSSLTDKDDLIFSDSLNHASIIDGCRLSRAKSVVFAHNEVSELSRLLAEHRARADCAFVVVEGVYSMEGDLAPVEDLVRACREYDSVLTLDDAHGTGVCGKDGRGTLGPQVEDWENTVLLGTLSKAIGSQGGYICCSEQTRDYLVNFARPHIFSTGLALPAAAGALEAVKMLLEGAAPFEKLRRNVEMFAKHLLDNGFNADAASAIFPVILEKENTALRVASALRTRGFYVGAVRPPAVPEGLSRLRITVSAKHERQQLVSLAELVGREVTAWR